MPSLSPIRLLLLFCALLLQAKASPLDVPELASPVATDGLHDQDDSPAEQDDITTVIDSSDIEDAMSSVTSDEVTTMVGEEETANESNNKAGGVCVDYTMEGYFRNKVHYDANPPSGFIKRPSTISPCQLEQLHTLCVNRINMYRSGALKFSDGSSDTKVAAGLSPLRSRSGSQMCSSEAAMGDLIANYEGGGRCAGAHANAFVCGGSGAKAQNSCCGRGGGSGGNTAKILTFDSVKAQMDKCLQMMWDEGIYAGQKGHWEIMRSTSYTDVSCGFAWSAEGRVFITQDFYTTRAACNPVCGACGGSDTCSSNPCSCGSSGSTAALVTPAPVRTPTRTATRTPTRTATRTTTRTAAAVPPKATPTRTPNPTPTRAPAAISSSGKSCVAISSQASNAWCNSNCNNNPPYCPSTLCKCS